MRPVQRVVPTGLAGQAAVLAALDASVGLGATGWALGLAVGVVTTVALGVALDRRGPAGLGPADRVTLVRALLVGGVAALAVGPDRGALVALAVVALLLDWVDGRVARRTGTVSDLGARFDMEVDALLILVLSVLVAATFGAWVLLIGAARYLRLLACVPWPWLRRSAPPRYWAKVVAALQGATLTAAAAGVLPTGVAVALLVLAVTLLAESFGREVWWLWEHRPVGVVTGVAA